MTNYCCLRLVALVRHFFPHPPMRAFSLALLASSAAADDRIINLPGWSGTQNMYAGCALLRAPSRRPKPNSLFHPHSNVNRHQCQREPRPQSFLLARGVCLGDPCEFLHSGSRSPKARSPNPSPPFSRPLITRVLQETDPLVLWTNGGPGLGFLCCFPPRSRAQLPYPCLPLHSPPGLTQIPSAPKQMLGLIGRPVLRVWPLFPQH